jgi:hypothetical protein
MQTPSTKGTVALRNRKLEPGHVAIAAARQAVYESS